MDETSLLTEVNVGSCELDAVNICYFTACFSMDSCRRRIIIGFVFQNLFEETLVVIGKTWILICR